MREWTILRGLGLHFSVLRGGSEVCRFNRVEIDNSR